VGFTADVAALTESHVQTVWATSGICWAFLCACAAAPAILALRCDDDAEWDEGRSLFLTFNNSKYTGGTMLIAPMPIPATAY